MTEEWRPIPGFEGRYEVSNIGNVRSLDRTLSDGRKWRGRLMRQKIGHVGHRSVRLCKDGEHFWFGIHCLVLMAFVGLCPVGMQGAHNDGHPKNNILGNLRWDTPKGNNDDKYSHGTILMGERNNLSKLKEADIHTIRKMHSDGLTGAAIAGRMGVTKENIYYIIHRKTWKHI